MVCICLATSSLGFSLERSSPHEEQHYPTKQQQGTTATSQGEETIANILEWTTLSRHKRGLNSDLVDMAIMTQDAVQETAIYYVSRFS